MCSSSKVKRLKGEGVFSHQIYSIVWQENLHEVVLFKAASAFWSLPLIEFVLQVLEDDRYIGCMVVSIISPVTCHVGLLLVGLLFVATDLQVNLISSMQVDGDAMSKELRLQIDLLILQAVQGSSSGLQTACHHPSGPGAEKAASFHLSCLRALDTSVTVPSHGRPAFLPAAVSLYKQVSHYCPES